MVTVKLLSIHADNEQTLDERNTYLTVGAWQGAASRARGSLATMQDRWVQGAVHWRARAGAVQHCDGWPGRLGTQADPHPRSPAWPLQDPAAVALNTQFMERMAGEQSRGPGSPCVHLVACAHWLTCGAGRLAAWHQARHQCIMRQAPAR